MSASAPQRRADYYDDGVWYDAEYVHIRADLPYYRRVARETSGDILELACGTGRLSFPMAEEGSFVFGIDNAPAMIERAEAKRLALPPAAREQLRFRVADMRDVRFERTFDAVVLGFNTLMHMTDDGDLAAALETARAHLEPGGLFHLDLHTPFPEMPTRPPDGRYDPQEMIDPRSGDRFVVTENNRYDPRRQVNTMRFFYQRVDRQGRPAGPETMAELELRVLFPRELDRWLHLAGFEVLGDFDDFERQKPFSGTGGRRVLVTRRCR